MFNISKRITVKLRSFPLNATVLIAGQLITVVVIEIIKTTKLTGQKGHKLVVGSCSVNTLRVKFRALLINWSILPSRFKLNTIPAL